MKPNKKTLKRSIFIGTTLFILLLCSILSIVHYYSYKKILYSKYESRIVVPVLSLTRLSHRSC